LETLALSQSCKIAAPPGAVSAQNIIIKKGERMDKKRLMELAEWFYEVADEVFTGQWVVVPCVFYFDGELDFSRGDSFGISKPVYDGDAEIVISTERLRYLLELRDYGVSRKVVIESLYEELEEFLIENNKSSF
jgi:hypothetical protein